MGRRSLILIIPRTAGRTKRISAVAMAVLFLLLTAGTALAADVRPDCTIDEGPCTRAVRSLTITLDLSPKPVKAMRELAFSVMVRDKSKPVTDASVTADLTMPDMVMGRNTVMLQNMGNGRYEGKGVIVRCPTGKKVWKATVAVRRGGKTAKVPFLIEVH